MTAISLNGAPQVVGGLRGLIIAARGYKSSGIATPKNAPLSLVPTKPQWR